MTSPDCRYEQFCRAPGLLTLPGRPRVIGREIRTALNKEQREAPFHGTITRLWPTAFTNMVLALKEGHGSNVTHGCVGVALTYASRKKEDSESLKALAKHSVRCISE